MCSLSSIREVSCGTPLDTFYSGGYRGLDKIYPHHIIGVFIEPVPVLTEKPVGQGNQEIFP
jgi:hypothetical protein